MNTAAGAAGLELEGLTVHTLAVSVLPFRTLDYIDVFCEKLASEGIVCPADLLVTSVESLEMKLSTHASFNFIELADAISLRRKLERGDGDHGKKGGSQGSTGCWRGARQRSRSPPRRGGRDIRRSSFRGRGDRGRGDRGVRGRRDRRNTLDTQVRPELWAAVERGDEASVERLIQEGKDVEEKYDGWSPLMKAAEEGHVVILSLLLDRHADLGVTNRKGRNALSFAAAPSMGRANVLGALRVLLDAGADVTAKDQSGLTAKDRAKFEERDDVVEVIEEYENEAGQNGGGALGCGSTFATSTVSAVNASIDCGIAGVSPG